jgi:hypothetical protein
VIGLLKNAATARIEPTIIAAMLRDLRSGTAT